VFVCFQLVFVICFLQDSFCVNEEPQSEMMEASALEVAEAILEAESKWKRRKRKRMRSSSGSDMSDCGEGTSINSINFDSNRNRKRYCRIVTLESSGSENSQDVLVPAPKACTQSVNPDNHNSSGRISSVSNSETKFVYKKSVSHEASRKESLSTKENVSKTETMEVDAVVKLDWSDWNFENFELSSCNQDSEEKKKHTVTSGINETKEHVFNLTSEAAEQKSKFCSDEVGMNEIGSPILSCSGHSRKLVSKAVHPLCAEFDKEAVETSLSGATETGQLKIMGANNFVLRLPDNSSAGVIPSTYKQSDVTKKLQLKSNSTISITSSEVRNYRNRNRI
jgi:hypothetical protein